MEASATFSPHASFRDYANALFARVVETTRKSNELAFDDGDYEFYATMDGFKSFVEHHSKKLRRMMESVRKHQKLVCGAPDVIKDDEELDDWLIEANDCLLEDAGSLMDDVCGFRNSANSAVVSKEAAAAAAAGGASAIWNKKSTKGQRNRKFFFLHSKNLTRPQLQFKTPIDNSKQPFVHRLRSKPNALMPPRKELSSLQEMIKGIRKSTTPDGGGLQRDAEVYESCDHPYETEISQFKPSEKMTSKCEPQMYRSFDETELVMVTSESQLVDLSKELLQQEEFAVDLENHSYRSFQGFTCLMQISTRKRDFVIDTLILREHMHVLNESFTNPRIVKVFHGADMDIVWLQRDYGVYVVNLFDTFHAACVLEMSRKSLAFLLQHYCKIDVDKEYQLADWRIRPLPEELVNYARGDTHYLLYVYDKMRNELLNATKKKNGVATVFSRSKGVCLKTYSKPVHNVLEVFRKQNIFSKLNSQQIYAVEKLFEWRDYTARKQDESHGYVLPNHMLLQIAQHLPREPEKILACCSPVPPLVRQHLQSIHQVVLAARKVALKATGTKRSRDAADDDDSSSRRRHIDDDDSDVQPVRIVSGHTLMSSGPPVALRSPVVNVWEK